MSGFVPDALGSKRLKCSEISQQNRYEMEKSNDSMKRPKEDRSAPSSNDDDVPQLANLPTTIFLMGVCPFIPLEDILVLRVVSRKINGILHGEGQEDLWKMVLQRDFEFSESDLTEENQPILTVILGHIPEEEYRLSLKMRFSSESLFDAVKKWKKTSAWYYSGLNLDAARKSILEMARDTQKIPSAAKAILSNRHPHVRGPFFIRAASVWEHVVDWCENGPRNTGHDISEHSMSEQRVRDIIYESIDQRSSRWISCHCSFRYKIGSLSLQALRSFSSGQSSVENRALFGLVDGVFYGLMGGYEAYSYYRSNSFDLSNGTAVSENRTGHDPPHKRWFLLDPETGALVYQNPNECKCVRLQHQESREDELLLWMEEYVRRLREGEIGVGTMGFRPSHPKGITLFPRYIPGAIPKTKNGVPLVNRKVTRGVEVIASAVFVPQMQDDFGFIYSVRIRLLTPDDGEEYVSPEVRGFSTCQLMRRHWEIVNEETGTTQVVDGEAVLGMQPILRENSYNENGVDYPGTFQYQSCTGPMKFGRFGGYLTFESRSGWDGNDDSTLRFHADVGHFALDSEPDFLY